MCLITKNVEGEVSDKPVVCYKMYNIDVNGRFVSPFQGVCYNLKEGDEIIAGCSEEIKKSPNEGYYGLGQGFIHATTERWMPVFVSGLIHDNLGRLFQPNKDEQYVDETLGKIISYLTTCHMLCEMEIPAGERYWKEKDTDLLQRGIRSHRMIFRRDEQLLNK